MRNFFVLLFVMFSVVLFAQDRITLSDGTSRTGKIISEDQNFVRMKLDDGTVSAFRKAIINELNYGSGQVQKQLPDLKIDPVPRSRPVKQNNRVEYKSDEIGSNIISFNYFNILHSNISISYERIYKSGIIGVKIPVSVRLGASNRFFAVEHDYYTGIDLNFYPVGQNSVSYFLGPAIRVGSGTVSGSREYIVDQFNTGYPGDFPSGEANGTYVAFKFNNGIMFQPTPEFYLSLDAGLGLRQFFIDNFEANSRTFFNFGAHVGFRF